MNLDAWGKVEILAGKIIPSEHVCCLCLKEDRKRKSTIGLNDAGNRISCTRAGCFSG